jgi:hypothetical protein
VAFQFDYAPHPLGRQLTLYLAFLLTENQQACCLNLHLNVLFGQKKKKEKRNKIKITLFKFIEFSCFIFWAKCSSVILFYISLEVIFCGRVFSTLPALMNK